VADDPRRQDLPRCPALQRRATRGADRPAPARHPIVSAVDTGGPEDEALIADSVGLALLIVLDTLAPAERLAFVLHDIFDVRSSRSAR
jgi:DNA-directed RNA polymerase specialized sigma24 family protein